MTLHNHHYPGESEEYRKARDELLLAECELIQQVEKVAAMRRALPAGGLAPEDYVFEEGAEDLRDTQTVYQVKLSELFDPAKPPVLVLINTMFAPDDAVPCPACNSLADGYNATAPHITDRINFALVTKAPIAKLRNWAATRDWRDIRLLSSYHSSFNRDYHAELEDGGQTPTITVFTKGEDGSIRHFYSIESLWTKTPEGLETQDPRHLDLFWPLWHLLDLTPQGRGEDWYPRYSYQDKPCCK